MDKIKITVNGKSFEAEGNSLMEIIDKFLNESVEEVEQHINDVPKPYKTYEEYLGLNDFDIAKCSNKETLDDLKAKLQKRINWVVNHPSVDMTDINKQLQIKYEAIKQLNKKIDYMKRAYEEVQLYATNINYYTNNRKNKNQ